MNSEPLVSVITPAFNAAGTVRQTIESVLAQTYRNWELLVVDDASTDGTAEIVAGFAARDPRIHLIRLPVNTGAPGRAKNAALSECSGELVSFLDADDQWMPNKLAVQVAHFDRTDIDLCYSGGWYVDEALNPCGTFIPRQGEGWLFDRLLAQYDINNQTVMARRSAIFSQSEPRFKPDIVIGEDYELFMRIARTGKLRALPDQLAIYRLRPDSVSGSQLEHAHEGVSEVVRWVSADRELAARCGHSLDIAKAKERYYRAKAAMMRGDRSAARALMFPVFFVDWRFAVLALATLHLSLWQFCMGFARR